MNKIGLHVILILLNVAVIDQILCPLSPKITYSSSNTECDDIWRLGFRELIRFRGSHEDQLIVMRCALIKKRDIRVLFLSATQPEQKSLVTVGR